MKYSIFLIRYLFLPALVISLLVINVIAQPKMSGSDDRIYNKAIEFRFGPNFVVGNLNGSAISLKWGVSQTQANRIGLSFDSGLNFGSASETDNDLPHTSEYDFYFRLDADRIHYHQPNSKIAFYLGYGPRLGFGVDRSEERIEDSTDLVLEKTRRLETGLGALAGVEWFVSRSLSLSGEYGINTTYAITRQTKREGEVEQRNQTQQSLQLAGTFARLRIALYFH